MVDKQGKALRLQDELPSVGNGSGDSAIFVTTEGAERSPKGVGSMELDRRA